MENARNRAIPNRDTRETENLGNTAFWLWKENGKEGNLKMQIKTRVFQDLSPSCYECLDSFYGTPKKY